MASIRIENVSEELHQRLKDEAERNRRSMPQQALSLLEQALGRVPPVKPVQLPDPIVPKRPFTQEWLSAAIREGRE